MRKYLVDLYFSFPFQLLVLHVRNNYLMLLIWLLLALLVTGDFAKDYGVYYLFVSPEYLGNVSMSSFFLLGTAFGIFVMCWHLSTYLLYAWRFPFLAAIKRPFYVFCFNNSLIPLLFFILCIYCQISFEKNYEFLNLPQYVGYSTSFLLGSVLFVALLSAYFIVTNKNIGSYKESKKRLVQNLIDKKQAQHWRKKAAGSKWRIDFFINEKLHVWDVNKVMLSNETMRNQVLRQNHYNALFLQCTIIAIFLILGFGSEKPLFRLPAGANIFLLAALVVSFIGAFLFWFRHWYFIAFLVFIFTINYISQLPYFNKTNKAYGLNYTVKPASYSTDSLSMLNTISNIERDKLATIQILEKWRLKNQTKKTKPPLVIICVSGGGLKASAWAMQVLQTADSLSHGKLMSHTVLMTGASGGMLGAAYFRELVLRKKTGQKIDGIYGEKPLNDVTKDLMNAISSSILTNDLFLPQSTFRLDSFRYRKDRGYAFERQFHENTEYRLDKKLADYRKPEQEAIVPMMFLTPAILNDGKTMVISPQPVAYMMRNFLNEKVAHDALPDAIDFGAFLQKQQSGDLRFASALRASATFPYILPNVQLPTQPIIELVDAGFNDNLGLKSALRFAFAFEDWISKNTSSVTFVTVRAFESIYNTPNGTRGGVFSRLFDPLTFSANFLKIQEYDNHSKLNFLRQKTSIKNINVLNFLYTPSQTLRDSPTSFHLTSWERQAISAAIQLPSNQLSLKQLLETLK